MMKEEILNVGRGNTECWKTKEMQCWLSENIRAHFLHWWRWNCGVWAAEVQDKGLSQLTFEYLMERKKSAMFAFSIRSAPSLSLGRSFPPGGCDNPWMDTCMAGSK